MRIPFRTKIFLGLVIPVIALLGIALAAVERIYDQQIRERIKSQASQAGKNYDRVMGLARLEMEGDADKIASDTYVQAALEEMEKRREELSQMVFSALQTYFIKADIVIVTTRDHRSIVRLINERDVPALPVKRDDPVTAAYPETALVRLVRDPNDVRDTFLEINQKIYLALAKPSVEGGGGVFRAVVVVGRRVSDMVGHLHAFQPPEDHIGFVLARRAVTSLPAADAKIAVQEESPADVEIDGHPFHFIRSPIPGTAVQSVQLISLQSLFETRANMRRMIGVLAAAAVLVTLLISSMLSRGISSPVLALVEGTRKVAQGDYAHRISISSKDELGDLAGEFNRMAGDLASKEKVRAVLNKVVAREVADELLQGDIGLGGRLVRATLVFADLRNFTGMTQAMKPQDVVAMLNEYLTAMHREISAGRGIVDKYVGDEIIGVFGAPKSYGNDALSAVQAALRMQAKLGELNAHRAGRGDPPLAMGVGIHTGEVVAGCMGSQEQMNYTFIGAAMNLASRLCSNAKAGQVIVSAETKREIGDQVSAAPLPPIQVKGFTDPVPIFEVKA